MSFSIFNCCENDETSLAAQMVHVDNIVIYAEREWHSVDLKPISCWVKDPWFMGRFLKSSVNLGSAQFIGEVGQTA